MVSSSTAIALPRTGGPILPGFVVLRNNFACPVLRLIVVSLVLAHLLDVLTTTVALAAHQIEMNPILAMVMGHFGFAGLLIEKVVVCAITITYMNRLPRGWAAFAGLGATAIATSAVLWNLHFTF